MKLVWSQAGGDRAFHCRNQKCSSFVQLNINSTVEVGTLGPFYLIDKSYSLRLIDHD